MVNSLARDFYTETKRAQERMVVEAQESRPAVLRPTLMFGWFDRKHWAGWRGSWPRRRCFRSRATVATCASRSMPAISARSSRPASRRRVPDEAYNISGQERIDYIDLIRAVRGGSERARLIVRIPYGALLGPAAGLRSRSTGTRPSRPASSRRS